MLVSTGQRIREPRVRARLAELRIRRTRGPALELALDLHPDWVYESDLSVLRRGHVIRIEGVVDSFDGEVLRRSLERMTRDLSTDDVLALDLRRVASLTPGVLGALVEGTRAYRGGGGRVRCALPETDVGRLLTTTGTPNTVGFEVERHA